MKYKLKIHKPCKYDIKPKAMYNGQNAADHDLIHVKFSLTQIYFHQAVEL